ncbi:MAG: PaaI family thioesterase [Peptoniphilus sp. oral taxon 375]|uniref:PaaI family thioesterase n=1 Tax=Urinicoccus timonensis TaxID=2024205 RepID=UPI000C075772|nr:PaaI family thioesterase [Urinicoccus timonensis]MBS4872217.1 PaaI family thioesterase [Peptoniphilus sp. oral taxon 375]
MGQLVLTEAEVRERFKKRQVGFYEFFNFEFEELTDDHLTISLDCGHEMLNPLGNIHGGVLFTIGDQAAGVFAMAVGRGSVTLKGSMDYLRPGQVGKIYATASLIHRTKRTVLLEVSIEQNQRRIAYGVYNFYVRTER